MAFDRSPGPRLLTLVHDDPATVPAPIATTPTLAFPDGLTVPLRPRGVYRADTLDGGCFTLYAVDSRGDRRRMEELVPITATAEEFREAELRLWSRLDAADPVAPTWGARGPLVLM